MKRDNPELEAVYHELSEKYGQTMTMQDACKELHVQTPRAARSIIPDEWHGERQGKRQGKRIRTYSFARQLVAWNG